MLCCPLPHSTHARTCTHTHERARTRGRARHIGSAAPGRPSQLKRRLWTAPLAHASMTRRARAADAFWTRGRYVSQPKGVGFSYCDIGAAEKCVNDDITAAQARTRAQSARTERRRKRMRF